MMPASKSSSKNENWIPSIDSAIMGNGFKKHVTE